MYIVTCAMCNFGYHGVTKHMAEVKAWKHVHPNIHLKVGDQIPSMVHHHVVVFNEEDLINGGTP